MTRRETVRRPLTLQVVLRPADDFPALEGRLDRAAAVEACVAAFRERLVRESRAGMLPWGWVMASEEEGL